MLERTALTRRQLLISAASAGLGNLIPSTAEAACASPNLIPIKARPERAVSLRQLSAMLAAGRPARLEGLTRLDGFAVDEANRDVVLFGLAERTQPELHVADFVVALRSAFSRGDVYRKSAAISIDSDARVYLRLDQLKTTRPEGRREYEEICKRSEWRPVRVDGMPRNSRVAKVLVDADIRMKRVAQGVEKLPLTLPFPGDFEAKIRDWRALLTSGRESNISASITRYWFMPGRFTYAEAVDRKMARIDIAQVVLKDEDEVQTSSGGTTASGKVDPYARAFTCAWTERMDEIYKAEPLWRDMHNMYRHFALARIIYDLDAFNVSGFDASYLLDRFDLPAVDVPSNVPGSSRVETLVTNSGGKTWTNVRSVCGGVDIGFNKPIEKAVDSDGSAHSGRLSVLASRSTSTVLAWAVAPQPQAACPVPRDY